MLNPRDGVNLSREQFLKVFPNARSRVDAFLAPLNAAMAEFGIDTPARQRAFLAQLAHESGELKYMREIASGAAYEGAARLGNTQPGDGMRFKGRGPMQITGRRNYTLAGEALGLDLLEHPELLEQPEHGCRSAAWFWRVGAGLNLGARARNHGIPEGCDLNDYADAGDFESITLAINGGMNGWEDRKQYHARAQTAIAEAGAA